jgi:hypothetical protein
VLNSTKIREHLEQCASMSADLQQKLHSLSSEWRHLKFREEVAAAQVVKVNPNMRNGIGKSVTEEVAIVHTSYHKLMGQLLSRSSCMSPFSTNINPLGDRFGWPVPNDSSKQPCWLYSKGSSENHSTSSGSQIVKMHDVESQKNQLSFGKNGLKSENPLCRMVPSCARESYSRQNMLPLFIPQQQKDKSSGENVTWSNYEGKQDLENGSIDGSMVPYGEFLRGHLSSDTIRTHVAEHVHALHMNNGNLFPSCHSIIQPAVKESQAKNLKASFLKKEIDVLQDSIASLESQLLKVSLRKDFLGRDSAGRLYWGFSWPGTPPWVVIDGTMIVLQKKIEKQGTSYMCMRNDDTTFPWISFQSDTEIEELIQWLRDTYPLERELLDAILQWQNITCKDSNKAIDCVQDEGPPTMSRPVNGEEVVNSNCLAIRALVVLEKKFGACLKSESVIPIKQSQKAEVNFTEQMCRCDCLELIWPSRCHCYSCHQSFSTSEELKRHDNGMCYPSVPTSVNKVNGNALKGKEMMRTETSLGECSNEIGIGRVSGSAVHEVGVELNKIPKELACPFDIEEISTKFITKDSNKELVQGIGLIGSNGVPSFVPSTSSYLDDPTLKLEPSWKNEGKQGGSKKMKISERQGKFSINSTRRFAKNGIYVEALKLEGSMKDRVQSSLLKCKTSDLRFGNGSIICESSSRPIIGREVQLLRQLKMNLLDMDSALPEEALKPSRAGLDKRRAWCAFVKSAKSILEMVQATIVLEDMIKTEYLRSGWQYWSSLCAAARIATISSLALRICTLDAALVYEKPLPSSSSTEIENLGSESDINILTCSNPINTPKTGCNPVQKTCGVVLTDNANPSSKRSKRRKDSGG